MYAHYSHSLTLFFLFLAITITFTVMAEAHQHFACSQESFARSLLWQRALLIRPEFTLGLLYSGGNRINFINASHFQGGLVFHVRVRSAGPGAPAQTSTSQDKYF